MPETDPANAGKQNEDLRANIAEHLRTLALVALVLSVVSAIAVLGPPVMQFLTALADTGADSLDAAARGFFAGFYEIVGPFLPMIILTAATAALFLAAELIEPKGESGG